MPEGRERTGRTIADQIGAAISGRSDNARAGHANHGNQGNHAKRARRQNRNSHTRRSL